MKERGNEIHKKMARLRKR